MKFTILIINIVSIFLMIHTAYSQESMIYADYLSTDEFNNIDAKGNVKIIHNDEIISSDNIYIDEQNKKIILNDKFTYKDKSGNYYFGSSGEFSKDFTDGKIIDFGYIGVDNIRLAGISATKKGNVDIIKKGVVTPCRTLKFFNCPLWQVKASTLIHDKEKFLIYQKNSRLEVLKVPVFYTPYSISPSPLRKERRSGFLYPTIVPFNSTHGGSAKLPYYFNISPDKELLITPTFYYMQNSQSILYSYNQRLSGGHLKLSGSTLTNFNKNNDFEWLEDANLSMNFKQNINTKFTTGLNVNLQTKGTYLREYDSSNPLNLLTSLNTLAYLDGYSVFDQGDLLTIEGHNFQAVKKEINNKKIPVVAPVVNYNLGNKLYLDKVNIQNKFLFYNIYRDLETTDHALRQTRINHNLNMNYQNYWKNSRLRFEAIVQTDFYNTFKKKIDEQYYSDEHIRIFPMTGIFIDRPYINKNNTIYNPMIFLSVNGSNNNTVEISNELTTDNEFDISRFFSVNRYTGNDKFDNGQRIGYGLGISNTDFKLNIAQGYQISDDNDYTKDINMTNNFSDVLGDLSVNNIFNSSLTFGYDFRYSPSEEYIYSQNAGISGQDDNIYYSLGYHNSTDRASSLSFGDRESIGINIGNKDFAKYSKIDFTTSYDLIENSHQTSTFTYNYSDECYDLNAIYNKNFFTNTPDTLTLTMGFKFIGGIPQGFIEDLILAPLDFKEE